MKTLTKIRKWLAERLYPIDVVELTRSQLTRVDREVSLDLGKMSKDEISGFLGFAETTLTNPHFLKIVDPLIFSEIDHIARFSKDREDDLIARGTINGVERVKEEFGRLSALHREMLQQDKFNKFDIM